MEGGGLPRCQLIGRATLTGGFFRTGTSRGIEEVNNTFGKLFQGVKITFHYFWTAQKGSQRTLFLDPGGREAILWVLYGYEASV